MFMFSWSTRACCENSSELKGELRLTEPVRADLDKAMEINVFKSRVWFS